MVGTGAGTLLPVLYTVGELPIVGHAPPRCHGFATLLLRVLHMRAGECGLSDLFSVYFSKCPFACFSVQKQLNIFCYSCYHRTRGGCSLVGYGIRVDVHTTWRRCRVFGSLPAHLHRAGRPGRPGRPAHLAALHMALHVQYAARARPRWREVAACDVLHDSNVFEVCMCLKVRLMAVVLKVCLLRCTAVTSRLSPCATVCREDDTICCI